ncbi:HAD family hydrolase [Zavarzinia compransoris]|uniref:HAD family hydrolase n=1 Tax=Zavarzinia marina TaxID=2911065 RepID=UPI001F3114BB|nr:HAD family hydrolase [Zavarzinia marina]MCF4164083.1 HAD family hydrolase [Zavarzinia marina]
MPNLLVILDIDGTLIRSTRVDDGVIAAAWADLHGHAIDTNWSRYRTSTDRGIAREILGERLNRPSDDGAITQVEDAILGRYPADLRLEQMPGAQRLVSTLRALPGVGVAIASGSFPRTARLKLGASGLHVDQVPKAFSDAHDERAGVIEAATRLACAEHAIAAFAARVYVGDGVWDLAAARSLGIGFVGIGDGAAAERLRAAGATRVLPDFADLQRALDTIFTAALVREEAA